MKNLNIGSVEIPINAATKTFAILAKRGAGKSYTAAVLAEEFAKNGIPFVIFDPIDVWWGLRLKANGKTKGLPVVVFGVEHADIKLDREMGRKIAQAVVQKNISCVISTFGMPKVAQRHLIAEFAEELLNINNTPRHIFIEEAHEFVPQRVMAGNQKCFSAVEKLVTMGRNRGIGVTLINQRSATVNKDVLTQIDTLIALRSVGPQDRKALQEWVEYHSAAGDFNKFIESLPSLPTGEAWIWSPEFMNIFERIKIRARETFHPDREKLGDEFVMPQLDSQDIEEFVKEFSKPERKPLKIKPDIIPVPEIREIGDGFAHGAPNYVREILNLKNGYESKLIEKDTEIARLKGYVDILASTIRSARAALGAPSDPIGSSIASGNKSIKLWLSKLGNSGAARIFKFLADNPNKKFSRQQIGLAVQLSSGSGSFATYISTLKRNKLILEVGGQSQISPDL